MTPKKKMTPFRKTVSNPENDTEKNDTEKKNGV